jgi:hypothetical protein
MKHFEEKRTTIAFSMRLEGIHVSRKPSGIGPVENSFTRAPMEINFAMKRKGSSTLTTPGSPKLKGERHLLAHHSRM